MSILKKLKEKTTYYIYRSYAMRKRKADKSVKWGIIGLGYMAETFTQAIECSPNSTITAVASRNINKAKEFAKKHNVAHYFSSYEKMLLEMDKELDIIYIATPHILHYQHILLCLNHNYNILCEKPIVSTFNEFKEIAEITKKRDCFLMEGLWSLLLPTYKTAKIWVQNNKIGKIQAIHINILKKNIISPQINIYNPKMGGGVMHDYGIYALSFPFYFLDSYNYTIIGCNCIHKNEIDADWNIILNVCATPIYITISSIRKGDSTACIIGEQGTIEIAPPFNRSNNVSLYDNTNKLIENIRYSYRNQGFEFEVKEIETCILKKHTTKIIPLKLSETISKLTDELNIIAKQL